MRSRDPIERERPGQSDEEVREHIATLAGAAGRFLAAGWSGLWMSSTALLVGVIVGFAAGPGIVGFAAGREEAARANAAPSADAVASLRRALDASQARVAASDEVARRAQLTIDGVTRERNAAVTERAALLQRLAAAEARPACPAYAPPLADEERDAYAVQLALERAARTQAEASLQDAQRRCALLLMLHRGPVAPVMQPRVAAPLVALPVPPPTMSDEAP